MGSLFSKPNINVSRPPTPQQTTEEVVDEQGKIRRSRDAFLTRQAQLGPIQLQASALGGVRPRT